MADIRIKSSFISATSFRISWLDDRGDVVLDFSPAEKSGALMGERVLAKEDCSGAFTSGGTVFLGDKSTPADLDTSGNFLNWGSGNTLITEYTGTVTVLGVAAVVELGGDLREA